MRGILLRALVLWGLPGVLAAAEGPRAVLIQAERLEFPAPVDSNSPAFWTDRGLHVLNSVSHPYLSSGEDLDSLRDPTGVLFDGASRGPRWMESVVAAPDGTLYGYYHFEPMGVCQVGEKTAPEIGAARSRDGGQTWRDLGIVLRDSRRPDCDSANLYFVGGVGDFTAVLDRAGEYVHFFFTSYNRDLRQQGVALARMAWADRNAPVGKVSKWHKGGWSSVGIGGPVTPLYPALQSWHELQTDSFWGPAVHWNTSLDRYVMLLSRANDAASRWSTEGIYVAYADRLDDPSAWSEPEKLLDGGSWYPQVIGLEPGEGTDAVSGGTARFFMGGVSDHLLVFTPLADASNRRRR